MLEEAATPDCGLGHGGVSKQPKASPMPNASHGDDLFSDIDFPREAEGVNDAGEVERIRGQLRMSDGF
jgi:hypothetical protein